MEFKEFIKVYPNFKDCAIQTFDDNSTRKSQELAKIYHASTVDWQLVKNLNTAGAGVFFSVNSMIPWKRDKKSVTNLNTWIVECDELSKEEQQELIDKAPLKPSCIIESNKSYHIYYFAENAKLENWERVNRWLREYYHGDQAICSDTARVLRLPWTYHNKWEPYKITCKYCEDIKYKEEDMLAKFPYQEIVKEKKEIKKNVVTKARNLWELMGLQSNRYMLDRISWSRLVKWESISYSRNADGTDQIHVNAESTGAWIDHNDYIGSAKDWWPTWIQWCVYYGNTKWDIAKWFTEFCDDLIPNEFNRTVQIKEIQKIEEEEKKEIAIKERNEKLRHISYGDKMMKWFDELINTDPSKVMKRWREEWDNYLWGIYWWKIYLIGADTGVGKSTFVNQVAKNLASAGTKVTRYSLEDRMEDSAKEDLYYMTNQYRSKKWKPKLQRIKFINWEYTRQWHKYYDDDICADLTEVAMQIMKTQITELEKNKDVTIDDLAELMHEECDKGTRVFIIDHLHYFQFENDKVRMDLQIEWAMKKINEVARQRDVAVFLVAHYNSTWWSWVPTLNSFKWSTGIKQIANIVIQISRDDDSTEFVVSKIRWPIKKMDIIAQFDIDTFEYNFTKTKEQKEKEKKISFTS